jgi:hypothetical protein
MSDAEPPSHPKWKAIALILGITAAILVLAAISTLRTG